VLRWILIGIGLIALAVTGTCFYGYKKLTGGGDTVIVTMAGTPERVFATLATPDSMALWMTTSRLESPTGGALLAVGDTLRFRSITIQGDSSGTTVTGDWIVREVNAPTLLVTEMRSDSGARTGVVLMRRDSLVAVGDSTTIFTTYSTPLFDSVSTTVRDSSKVGSTILGGATKMMVGVLRMTTEEEYKGLKKRVEGQ
jgi:uncharacterized protein YndB with AHSA1/START domain